jgi:GxxExxY protein
VEKSMSELLFKEEVHAIMGAAFEVYNELRGGFLESVYQEAVELELGDRGIPFSPQVPLRIRFKQRTLKKGFVADLVCYGAVLVELKAIQQLTKADRAQVLNYLRATGLRVGLLLNFGDPTRLEWERFIL